MPTSPIPACNALCFLATEWQGDSRPNAEKVIEAKFVDLRTPPEPIHLPTAHALELLAAYRRSGTFQVR